MTQSQGCQGLRCQWLAWRCGHCHWGWLVYPGTGYFTGKKTRRMWISHHSCTSYTDDFMC